MKKINTLIKMLVMMSTAVLLGSTLASSLVSADVLSASTNNVAQAITSNTKNCTDDNNVTKIVTKGDAEIARRLVTLSQLQTKINSSTKLTPSDSATLSAEVTSTTSGLNALKLQLDSDTTNCTARTDAQSIFSEYRVYAVVVPKVGLVKVADDQQAVESKLSALATTLSGRLNSSVKNYNQLKADLTDMQINITNAQSLSSSVESNVITVTPQEYDASNTVLKGFNTQLKNAHVDNDKALKDANKIISGLK